MDIVANLKNSWSNIHIRSLKSRVTIFTLAIFILGLWSLEFYASRMLREDMQSLLGVQQFSAVSFIAAETNSRIDDRLQALEKSAQYLGPAMSGKTADLQALLENNQILPILFNGGTFVTGLDGTATAAIPLSLHRRGVNYLDRDFIVSALKQGKTTIGRPVMGKRLKAPIIGMAVPIRDGRGRVVGALAGVTNLSAPNFLGKYTEGRYAKTGGYLLVAPQYRLIVTASDKSRIMETLPAPGVSPLIDRFVQGYEGSGIFVNPLGVEVLASAKSVPLSGWYVAVSLPTAEAFAPLYAMQQRMLKATLLLSLLAGVLTLWMLKRQLSPMLVAVRTLTAMANSDQPSQPLPIARPDEIGELIGGFNHLLASLAQREDALRESARQLAITMTELNIILENAPVGIFKLVDREPVWVNRAAEELFLYARGELVAQTTRKLYPSDEAYEELGREAYPLLVEGRIYECEREMTRKDGTNMLTRLIGKAIEPPDLAKGTIWLLEDITERKRLDLALQEKNAELEKAWAAAEKANRAKSEFLSGLSHELRAPLNAILGFAQLMDKASSQPTPKQKTSIDQILKAGWYLLKLINEILDLALIESGKLSMVPEPVALAEVMRECQALVEPQAKQGDIRLRFPRFKFPYFVQADRTRLKQVLINLLSNAIKYNRLQGAVEVRCSVAIPGRIRISVQDTGEGLSPEKLAQLFQPFNRLGQEASPVEGTGIGLVMSKKLVELMGGEIGVESTVGAGTLFWIELALVAEPARDGEAAEARAVPEAPVSPGGVARTLLYIEDNRANMQLVEQLIDLRPDLRLLGAADGRQGIALARLHRPEVILMDINLHGISGITALKILREDPATAHIPVLAVSANAMPHEIKKGLELGFCHYLTKPIKIDEFMKALDLALDLAKKV